MVHHLLKPPFRCFYIAELRLCGCGPLVKWPKTPASHAGNMGSNPVRVTIFLKLNIMILDRETYLIYSAEWHTRKVGVDCGEGPPVPIPNTEVKLACAEDTWREAARENK